MAHDRLRGQYAAGHTCTRADTHTHTGVNILLGMSDSYSLLSLSLFNLVTHREVDCPQVSWSKMKNSPQGPLHPLSLSLFFLSFSLSLPFLSPPLSLTQTSSLLFSFFLSPPSVISLCVCVCSREREREGGKWLHMLQRISQRKQGGRKSFKE